MQQHRRRRRAHARSDAADGRSRSGPRRHDPDGMNIELQRIWLEKKKTDPLITTNSGPSSSGPRPRDDATARPHPGRRRRRSAAATKPLVDEHARVRQSPRSDPRPVRRPGAQRDQRHGEGISRSASCCSSSRSRCRGVRSLLDVPVFRALPRPPRWQSPLYHGLDGLFCLTHVEGDARRRCPRLVVGSALGSSSAPGVPP